MCSLPKLFAAYHVLHRLLVPRHSPYALSSLTFFGTINFVLLRQNSSLLRRHTICIVSLQLIFFPCTTRFFFQIYLNLYSSFKYNFCLTFGFIVYSYEYSSLPFFLEYLIYSTIYFSMCYSLKQYTSFYVVRFLRDFVNIQLVLFPRHSSSS